MGLSVGANVLVARHFAAKEEEELKKTVHTSITVSVLCGIALAIIGMFAAKQLLIWMQSPEEVINLAALYLRIYFLGMPATMAYNFGAAILRGVGGYKTPIVLFVLCGNCKRCIELYLCDRFSDGCGGGCDCNRYFPMYLCCAGA